MLTWLRDLLVESPVPPSNWMPSRSERLADARLTLRRRSGEARGTARPAHHLRDLGSAHPLASASRFVSGEEIEADLEEDISTVNPPTIPGWAYVAFAITALAVVVGIGTIRQGIDPALGSSEVLGAPIAWLLAMGFWGAGQRTLELRADGVRLRRWTDAWLGRPGMRLGRPDELRATLLSHAVVVLSGPGTTARLSISSWGSTARADLVDELPIWGIDCDFGQHQAHHHGRGRRARNRRA